ncbi:MFS general substrate transporter [Sanghuangporus baumii]|uniref:MFS general substrate transporter n=1 Tax=Sanghuangporus baumii TaxID=108892 RepID=A0A9Q5NCI3_SANBA|nr:MFS general substrate transporter [Sanghuangporus baumii]
MHESSASAKDDSIDEKRSLDQSAIVTKPVKSGHDDDHPLESAEALGIDEKRLLRKMDFCIIPWLALLYLLNFLDRATIGNAKLYGLETDLRITDRQYLIALTCFFFPYALFEPPSNIMLKKLKPSRWLSFLILCWGIVLVMHGVIKDYGSLVTFSKPCESYLDFSKPDFILVSRFICPGNWYKRSELGTRVAFFFTSATVAGAFGGLLAAAIAEMDGIGGKKGWEWIFIIEGLLTVVVGIVSPWMVHDFPDTARFLNERERQFVIERLQADQQFSAGGEKFQMKYIKQCLKDVKTYLAMAIYMGFDGPLFAFSLFLPTIINQLGYTSTAANLLSVPVYAWGCLVTLFVGFFGDRIGERAYLNMALFAGGMVGYIILIASRKPALSYFACFLGASGIYPLIPNSVAWVSANTEGSYKRSAVLGMAIGWGNLNGAVSSNVYRAEDKPWYSLGHGIVLAYIVIGFFSSWILRIVLKAENARRERGERDEVIGDPEINAEKGVRVYERVEAAKIDKGDFWSGFRYTL